MGPLPADENDSNEIIVERMTATNKNADNVQIQRYNVENELLKFICPSKQRLRLTTINVKMGR